MKISEYEGIMVELYLNNALLNLQAALKYSENMVIDSYIEDAEKEVRKLVHIVFENNDGSIVYGE